MRNASDNATYKHMDKDKDYKGRSEHGRSTVILTCPWCNTETEAYIWSLSGGGKKCDGCPSVHGSIGTSELKDKDRKKFTKMTGIELEELKSE